MPSIRYCLQEPILSIQFAGGEHRECFYIPAGEVISVVQGASPNDKFVEASWDAKKVWMFLQDLQERAEIVFNEPSEFVPWSALHSPAIG